MKKKGTPAGKTPAANPKPPKGPTFLTSDNAGVNPDLGNFTALHNKTQPVSAMTPAKGEYGSNPATSAGIVRTDYFRDDQQVGRNGKDLPVDLEDSINPMRVWGSVRMRDNAIRGLTFPRLVQYIDQWWYGQFRPAGMLWSAMYRRDYQLQICAPKRFKSVARHGFDVLITGDLTGDDQTLAEEQQTFLKDFYNNISTVTALNPDEKGGLSLLLRQMMESILYYYAVHEIVWEPKADGTLSARFIYCPVWWFEGVRGKLFYLDSEFQVWGREIDPAGWLISCNQGVMECVSIIYMFKHGALRSWASLLEKFGMPGLLGKTHAKKGTPEWNAMKASLTEFGQEWSTVIGGCAGDMKENDISLVQAAAGSNGDAYAMLIEKLDRAITQIFRGGDLGTSAGSNRTGASLQGDESEILETDDAKFLEETLHERVTKYALAWKFGPDAPIYAYIKLNTTPQSDVDGDIKKDTFILSTGGELGKVELYERYGRSVPKDGEEVVTMPQPPAPGQPEADQGAAEPGADEGEFSQSELANAHSTPKHVLDESAKVNTNPTDAQREYGNYAKGHVLVHGLEVSIENPKGTCRTGGPPENRWSVVMPCAYGYVRRYPEAADGDATDVFVGPHLESDKVFVVDQQDHQTKKWDEVKAMLAYQTKDEALNDYRRAFSDGAGHLRIQGVTEMTIAQFKRWLKAGGAKRPAADAQLDNIAPDPDAQKLARALAIDAAPLAGSLLEIYRIKDPVLLKNQLRAFMKRADESKKLGPDSETTRVLHSQFADAMASGPVVADKN